MSSLMGSKGRTRGRSLTSANSVSCRCFLSREDDMTRGSGDHDDAYVQTDDETEIYSMRCANDKTN